MKIRIGNHRAVQILPMPRTRVPQDQPVYNPRIAEEQHFQRQVEKYRRELVAKDHKDSKFIVWGVIATIVAVYWTVYYFKYLL